MATSDTFISSAILEGIEVVGDVEDGKRRKRSSYSVQLYVDDKEVAISPKPQSRSSELKWTWAADTKIFFNPSSTMKVVILRTSRINWPRIVVAECVGGSIEFLKKGAKLALTNKKGVVIKAATMTIDISVISHSSNNIKEVLKGVEENVARLKPGDTPNTLSMLGQVLKLAKNIMDQVTPAHPLLSVSWTIISSLYQAIQETDLQDDSIRGLARSLRELLDTASQNVALIGNPTSLNIVEEIGRLSLQVASLIDAYTKLRRPELAGGRIVRSQLYPDLQSSIKECQDRCSTLNANFLKEVELQTARQVKTIVDNQLRDEIKSWLKAPDASANLHEAQGKRQLGTCSWYLDGESFLEWLKEPGFLWVNGQAGSGKSILSSAVIDKVSEMLRSNESSKKALPQAISYFFFDGRGSQTTFQLHTNILRSLISQLSHRLDGVPKPLADLYKACGDSSQPSDDQLQLVLRAILDGFSHVYIIVDAVDECTNRYATLEWIKGLLDTKHPVQNLHILATSRPEVDIRKILNVLDPRPVEMGSESTNKSPDISNYIDNRVGISSNQSVQNMEKEIREVLKRDAGGSFRWVALQLAELEKCASRYEIEKRLKDLPKGLDEIYSRVLKTMDEAYRADTLTFLQWLAFSKWPMTLKEITETATIEFGSEDGLGKFNSDKRYTNPQDVLVRCSSFVTESGGIVKFSHFSVKEYLLSNRVESYFKIDATTSHTKITRISIAYLFQFDSWDPLTRDILNASPLAEYAAEYCIDHAQLAGMNPSVISAILTLLAPGTAALTNWVRIHNIGAFMWNFQDLSMDRKQTPSPLYLSSSAGLQEVSKYLVESLNADVNTGWGDHTPLYAASCQGYQEIVKLLLEHKADVNAGGEGGTPLYAASTWGYLETVNLLLEHKADVNAGGGHGTPLYVASWKGHQEIVKLLLEHKVDVNAGGKYGTPLYVASVRRHQEIVKLLLEHSADVNAAGKYGTPLYAASIGGHQEIVKLLLEHKADMNAAGEDRTLLYVASWWGRQEIVKLLLEHNADVNAAGRYGTPLFGASIGGHQEIVKLLLEHKVDVNVGWRDTTPLDVAQRRGHDGIVQMLLDNGAVVRKVAKLQ